MTDVEFAELSKASGGLLPGATRVRRGHMVGGIADAELDDANRLLMDWGRIKGRNVEATGQFRHHSGAGGHDWRADPSGGSYLRGPDDDGGGAWGSELLGLRGEQAEEFAGAIERIAPGYAERGPGTRLRERAAETRLEKAHPKAGGPSSSGVRDPDIRMQDDSLRPVPAWRLRSIDVVDAKMSGPMDANAVRAMLLNNGVKEDEMRWTGLGEWLERRQGTKVKPEDVRTRLDEERRTMLVEEETRAAARTFHT